MFDHAFRDRKVSGGRCVPIKLLLHEVQSSASIKIVARRTKDGLYLASTILFRPRTALALPLLPLLHLPPVALTGTSAGELHEDITFITQN